MQHLQDLCGLHAEPAPPRRGAAGQRPRRLLEDRSRREAVAFTAWATTTQGLTVTASAAWLGVAERTLRHWQSVRAGPGRAFLALGRPVARSERGARQEVLAFLGEYGLGTGLPTLRACFPEVARAELADLLRRARRVWRQRYHQVVHVLHWAVPGSVWAVDFAEAAAPVDGRSGYLLAVRDLASGQQLLWQPVPAPTAEAALVELASLFAAHGAPLVLKSDNGSAFGAGSFQDFLHEAGVIPLFSPPYTPSYNGSIEAGIGSLKARTEQRAARSGRPGEWTWDDVTAARLEANATARPRGERGPTPDQLWAGRRPPTAEERAAFGAGVERCRQEARAGEGYPEIGPLPEREERRLDRQAIARALVGHGYLVYARRRIPLPFTR